MSLIHLLFILLAIFHGNEGSPFGSPLCEISERLMEATMGGSGSLMLGYSYVSI